MSALTRHRKMLKRGGTGNALFWRKPRGSAGRCRNHLHAGRARECHTRCGSTRCSELCEAKCAPAPQLAHTTAPGINAFFRFRSTRTHNYKEVLSLTQSYGMINNLLKRELLRATVLLVPTTSLLFFLDNVVRTRTASRNLLHGLVKIRFVFDGAWFW